jgi:hypothetical protein
LVARDFNTVRRPEERLGGSSDWPNWMDKMEESISLAELHDLRYGDWSHFEKTSQNLIGAFLIKTTQNIIGVVLMKIA